MGPTRKNLTLVHANNKGSGLYSYPRSLISTFIVCLLESIISKLASCKISFQLVSVAEKTGLSLAQSETCKTCFWQDGLNVPYHLFKPEDPGKTSNVWNVIRDHVDLE